MPSETEIERLVVRLTGDTAPYQKSLKQADQATQKYTRGIEGRLQGHRGKFVAGQKTIDNSLKKTGGILTKTRARFIAYGKSLSSVGNRAKAVGMRAGMAGTASTLSFTAPIVGVGALATREFARFDQAMTKSTSIMKTTEEQSLRMRDIALDLSGGGKALQTPDKLAEAYFFLAAAGKDAEQSMALLPEVSKFATAGAFDMALATDLLTDAQSALGLSSKDAAQDAQNLARVSNVLVKANTLANSSVQQFSEALTNTAGASLKNFNKDVEEGVALLAAYADQGIKSNVAGTSLSRVMLLLSKASRDAADEHERLGFSVFDAEGKMRNFADIIENMEQITAGMSDEMKAATLEALGFEARIQQAILPLIGTSDAIRRYEKDLRDAKGTTQEVADKQMKSFSNQMKVLGNQIRVIAIDIGETLAPLILRLNDYVRRGIEFWNGLSKSTKQTILIIAGVVAAIGPLLIAFGAVAAVIGAAISGIGALVGAIGAILSPIGIATTAVVGLVAAIAAIAIPWDQILPTVKRFFQNVIGFITNFQQNIDRLAIHFRNKWRDVLLQVGKLFMSYQLATVSNTLTMLRTIFRLWVAWQGWMQGMFKRVFSVDFIMWVVDGITTAIEKFAEFAEFAWVQIKSIFSGRKPPSIQGFIDQIQEDFEKGAANTNFLETASDIIKEEVGNLENPLAGIKDVVDTALPEFNLGIKDQAEKEGEQAGKAAANAAQDAIKAAEDSIQSSLSVKDQEKARALQESVDNLTKSLQDQVNTFGMTSSEAAIYRLQMEGATDAQLEAARAAAKQLEALEKNKKLMEKGKDLAKQFRTPGEVLEDQRKELDELLEAGAINTDIYTKALKQAEEQARKDYTADFNVTGVDAVEAGSADALARLREFRLGSARIPSLSVPNVSGGVVGADSPDLIPGGGGAGSGGPTVVSENRGKPPSEGSTALLQKIEAGIQQLVEIGEADLARPGFEDIESGGLS